MSYVYVQSERAGKDGCDLWTVGHYAPDSKGDQKWNPESDHPKERAAADRVAYLNAGPEVKKLMEERAVLVAALQECSIAWKRGSTIAAVCRVADRALESVGAEVPS